MTKSVISRQSPHIGTGTESAYQYPWTEASGIGTKVSGTGTHSQKGVGIGIDQSGTIPMLPATLIFVPLHC